MSPEEKIEALATALESTMAMLLDEGRVIESSQPGEAHVTMIFPRASIRGAIDEIQSTIAAVEAE